MTYVLTIYYIGWGNRYDGSGNTDTVTTRLFRTKESAIVAARDHLLGVIEEQVAGGVREDPKFDDREMRATLDTCQGYNTYNFEDHLMLTLEICEIED